MGLFSKKEATTNDEEHQEGGAHHHVDTRVYDRGENSRFQNSRAYMLTLVAYLGIICFGYDTGVAGGIVSIEPFMKDFGYSDGSKSEKNSKGSNVVSFLQVGAFFGALGAAPVTQRLGRKYALMVGTLIFIIGSAVQTGARHDLGPMYAGRVIAGLGVGLMSTVCPTYVAEMAPKEVRGRITGLFQIVVVVGVAIAYWIEYAISVSPLKNTSNAWRIPIAMQLVPSGLMICLLPFLKESPRWLLTKNRRELALANLAWGDTDDPRVLEEFAEISSAHAYELENTAGTSFKEWNKKGMRIRFFIAGTMFMLQQWAGQNSISYYAPTIFQSIGLKGTSVGLLASGIYGIVKIVATSFFVFVGIERLGRRLALGLGAVGMGTCLLIIGAIFITSDVNPDASSPSGRSIAMAAMIYLFVIPYCFSWGPVPWVYCSEIFPMRLRHYGMAVAAASQWAFNFTLTKITLYLVTNLPDGRLFFMFAGCNVVLAIFGFMLPETKGLSIEEMDVLFGSTTREARDIYLAAQHKEQELQHGSLEKREIEHLENDKKV